MADMFSSATAYEATMGRWSARLAPLFVHFAAIPDGGRVLDVGCGTGSLVSAVAAAAPQSTIVGIDQALPSVQYARSRFADPRITWEVARRVDPESAARAERPLRLNQPGQLAALWHATGLEDVEESVLEMRMDFTSFDDYWQPLLQGSGSGPNGVYVAGLSPAHRDALRRALQGRLQADRPDGGFSLRAKALAVRGVVPQAL